MPDNPCTHCGGSGREPDPIGEAAQKLVDAIDADAPSSSLISAARHLGRMADAVIADRDARITFLEAALRDILGRFPPTETGTATPTQPQPCTWHDVRNWRAILDGNPPKAKTINQARAEHGLPPFDGALGQTPVNAYQPLVCGICGRSTDETWKPPCNDCPQPGGC